LGANIKLFPTTGLPGAAAVGFHGAVASILVLYFLFWLKVSLPPVGNWDILVSACSNVQMFTTCPYKSQNLKLEYYLNVT
jgi:hypothetical protein